MSLRDLCCFLILILISNFCLAKARVVEISIKNHEFSPNIITIKAGERLKLKVKNLDKTVEEFESFSLKREKIIPPGATARISIGPLKPGEYNFFGEFNADTAKGKIIVK